jgi:hypothetical protein
MRLLLRLFRLCSLIQQGRFNIFNDLHFDEQKKQILLELFVVFWREGIIGLPILGLDVVLLRIYIEAFNIAELEFDHAYLQ